MQPTLGYYLTAKPIILYRILIEFSVREDSHDFSVVAVSGSAAFVTLLLISQQQQASHYGGKTGVGHQRYVGVLVLDKENNSQSLRRGSTVAMISISKVYL